MSEFSSSPEADPPVPDSVDTTVAHSARVWNYVLGGKDNYPVDREAGDRMRRIYPAIVTDARQHRAFLARSVGHLADECGIRQFLDIGTGMPTHNNTHEVAQAHAPDSRVVYVDNDPLVLAHATALLTSSPEGYTDYVHADLRDPDTILAQARERLDFTQPIALVLLSILGHIPDPHAHPLVRHLVADLPVGSYLVISDGVNTNDEMVEAVEHHNEIVALPYYLRSPADIAAFFDGLAPVEPGIVSADRWRPDGRVEVGSDSPAHIHAGVARKVQ
ncbi:S-adenosyl methyltransferase [Streptomonospora alba]|uniref:S-adenosyl methyltransferase n=1 Tax=Streptomonospora alba TaxID=183763 RepID=A0A0C2G8J2_9ACTN|nr:SAM-dependent methyltransferase [Streptomonospora alba]KIH99698.1 S-adenosyl methyltransferase [Streptomonospora alba]